MAFKVGSTTIADNTAKVPFATVVTDHPATMPTTTTVAASPGASNPSRGAACYRVTISGHTLSLT